MLTENARVQSTTLGYEDHGIVTAVLHMEGAGWGQGFGLRCYGGSEGGSPEQNAALARFIRGVLRVAGVDSWEDVKGCFLRVRRKTDGGPIVAVGNLLKDEWFNPEEQPHENDG